MSNAQQYFALLIAAGATAITLFVTALLAPARLREFLLRLWRWLPLLAILATVVVCLYLQLRNPIVARLSDSVLPHFFREFYWCAVMVVVLGLAASAAVMWHGLKPALGRPGRGGPLDETWAALLARLGQARVDLWRQRVHLLVAPDRDGEGRAANIIRSAGPRVIALAPAGPGPLHAYVLREGVVLSCDGAWSGGLQADGAARMHDLGRKLRARGPERPIITGVTMLFPIEWTERPESVDHAVVAGEEIQVLYQSLQDRCPVVVLFSGLESVPGAPEFIRRMAAIDRRKTEARVGFEVPISKRFDSEIARRSMDWIGSWFHCVVLDLLVADLFDYRSNSELIRFDYEFRYRRRRLVDILEAAFLAHTHDQETILLRGGYFTAIGEEPGTAAFAPGLFYGLRPPILPERRGAAWTESAIRQDAWYWWTAVGLGAVTAVIALFAWLSIAGQVQLVGYGGLLTLAFTWVVVLLWPRRTRWPSPQPITDESS